MKESQCHENSRLLAELDRLKKRYAVQNLIRWIEKIVSKLKFLVIILVPVMQGILLNNS